MSDAREDAVCRGCYTVGNACGRCSKCEAFLLSLVEELSHSDPCSYDQVMRLTITVMHTHPCPHGIAQTIQKARAS